jgi:PqqD family protein of HPr-rel-A system
MTADPGTVDGIARADVTLQRVGKEAILHDARSGQAHVINASAARVWELCDGRPMDELLSAFAEPYGLTPEAVRADVERVLASFRELSLLDRTDATT